MQNRRWGDELGLSKCLDCYILDRAFSLVCNSWFCVCFQLAYVMRVNVYEMYNDYAEVNDDFDEEDYDMWCT